MTMNIAAQKNRRLLFYTIIFVAVIILYNAALRTYAGDDLIFPYVLDKYSLTEYLQMRYMTWSSRTVIEGLLALISRSVLLWKIVNTAVYILLAYSLYRLSNRTSMAAVYILILIYPISDLSSAGWMATITNYVWPAAFGLYSLVIIHRLVHRERVHWWEIVISILSMLIGTSVEQYCVIHLVFLAVYMGYVFINKRFGKALCIIAVQLIAACANLIYILSCPGDTRRVMVEASRWMPDFFTKNFFDKIIDGFEHTMWRVMSGQNVIFLIFTAFIFVCILKKTKSKIIRAVSAVPFFFTALISFGTVDGSGFLSSIVGLFKSGSGVNASSWNKLANYLLFVVYVVIIVCIVTALLYLFDNISYGIVYSLVFLLAIASGAVMGLSPTMAASSDRVFLFTYVLFIFIMLKVYGNVKMTFSLRELKIMKYSGAVICAAFVLNNLAAIAQSYGSL